MAGTAFSVSIKKFADSVPIEASLVYRKIALDMYTRIVERTRVDTGYCRGNWQVGVGTMPSGPIERRTTGVDTSPAIMALSDYKAEDNQSIFIVNHVHYAPYLEYGTEHRPGDHMVARTVAEFNDFLRKATG